MGEVRGDKGRGEKAKKKEEQSRKCLSARKTSMEIEGEKNGGRNRERSSLWVRRKGKKEI